MRPSALLLIGLLLVAVVLTSCSSSQDDIPKDGFPRGDLNMSKEERQTSMEERLAQAILSCEEKQEGDICTMQSPMGEMTGACTIQEETLACQGNRPERPQ